MSLHLGVWGKVVGGGPADARVVAVKVIESAGGGYLVLTREDRGEFDFWVEDLEQAQEFLDDFEVDWTERDTAGS